LPKPWQIRAFRDKFIRCISNLNRKLKNGEMFGVQDSETPKKPELSSQKEKQTQTGSYPLKKTFLNFPENHGVEEKTFEVLDSDDKNKD
jgi:hypothetical protein